MVIALAVSGGLFLLAVQPQLQDLRDIANDHARAVEVTTGIRAGISAARHDLFAAVARQERGGPAGRLDADVQLARLEEDVGASLPLVDAPAERADITALRTSLARCATEAAHIRRLVQRGDAAGARRALEPFLELTGRANEAADQIVTSNTGQVEQLSRSIRFDLRWTQRAAILITVLGAASALALLRRALRGLASEEAAANQRSADLEAFAARAAHELRTPLQTVSLALRTLEGGVQPRALDRARRSAERLRETVDGLLEFARAGGSGVGPAAADLAEVVGEVRDELAPHLADGHVSLQVDVPPGARVAMTPSHLATVIRNLVGNAVKYAADAEGARVTIRARTATRAVLVEVGDNGPGIASDLLPRVFDPFVRGTSRASGHGLGLATVKRLVEAHRGAVRIVSAPGAGTSVELDLPRPTSDWNPAPA